MIRKESEMRDFHKKGVGMQDWDPLPDPVQPCKAYMYGYIL